MANVVKALTINPGVIITQEQFEALSNAYNNY
jgi:hypothetical protein